MNLTGPTRSEQLRVGLHHVCFRARERADVDAVHDFLVRIGAHVVHPPEDGPWAPGYYSVLFEDPNGCSASVTRDCRAGSGGTVCASIRRRWTRVRERPTRAAADGGTRLGGAESKRRWRPRLPAPPSRVTLLASPRELRQLVGDLEPGRLRAHPHV